MKESRFSVLVVESNPDQVQLLEEAFSEMEEERFSRPAYAACRREYALDWLEALDLLASGQIRPDAVLLNISTGGAPSALSALQAFRAKAPGVAVLLMADTRDEAAALSLVRQGAQDYLIASEIDCAPLARALRCAVERSRLEYARESVSLRDDLTGLLNARGIALIAERDSRVADGLGMVAWTMRVELPEATAEKAPGRDLERLEVGERLSALAAQGTAAGRTGEDTFVVAGLAATELEAEAASRGVAACLEGLPARVLVPHSSEVGSLSN